MAGVARGVEHADVEVADADDLAVAHADPFEVDPLGGGEQVVRAVPPGQAERARHVVVVEVGVRDGGDLHPGLLGGQLDLSEVAWRVHDQGDRAVVDEVAPVAELGHLQGDDVHGSSVIIKVNQLGSVIPP